MINVEDITIIKSTVQKPLNTLNVAGSFSIDIYVKNINRSVPYIISVVPSSGRELDYTYLTIIDPYTKRPVGEFKSNCITPCEIVELLVDLVKYHIPESMVVIVRRDSVGIAIIDELLSSEISDNLYYDITENENTKSKKYGIDINLYMELTLKKLLGECIHNNKNDFVTIHITENLNRISDTSRITIGNNPILAYITGVYILLLGANICCWAEKMARALLTPPKSKNKSINNI